MKRKEGKGPFYVIMAIFALLVIAILIYPTLVMVISSFQDTSTSAFTLDNYIRIFTEFKYIDGFKNSVVLSIISSIIGLIVTTLATYAVHSQFPRLKSFFLTLANLTANYVGVPLAFGLILLMGNSGLVMNLAKMQGWTSLADFSVYSMTGLLLAFVYFQLPMGITLLLPIYDALDGKWREAASLLGASSFQFWKRIGIPVLTPSFIGVFTMMFANAIGTYDTAFALTGSSVNMISMNIANTIQGDIFALPEIGSAVAVVLGLILAINMVIGQTLQKRTRRITG